MSRIRSDATVPLGALDMVPADPFERALVEVDGAAAGGAGAKARGARVLEHEPGSGARRIPKPPPKRPRASLPPPPRAASHPSPQPAAEPPSKPRASHDEVRKFEAASERFAAVPGTLASVMDFEVADRETKKLASDSPYYDPPLVAALTPAQADEVLGRMAPVEDEGETNRLQALVFRKPRWQGWLATALLAAGNAAAWLADALLRWSASLRA